MKVLNIGDSRYKYPHDIKNLEDFILLINSKAQIFIQMQEFDEENCVFPFLVEEDRKTVYVNCMNVSEIFEEEITLLSRSEYEYKLEKCIQDKCLDCAFYTEDSEDNMRGHRNMLCLDGTCDCFTKKEIEA